MKKLIVITSIIGSMFALNVNAQTTNNPAVPTDYPPAIEVFLDHATNITVVAYADRFDSNHKYGGGLLALYNIGDYVQGGLGSDYAGQWRMFSGTVTVHKTWTLTSKLSVDTYGLVAAGTSIGGAGTDNGSLATGEGGGAHFKYAFSDSFGLGIGGGYVIRQNCGEFSGGSEMITASVSVKF